MSDNTNNAFGLAFDASKEAALITGNDYEVSFVNSAFTNMLAEYYSAFTEFLGQDAVAKNVIGLSLDELLEGCPYRKAFRNTDNVEYQTQLDVDTITFDVCLSLLIDKEGERQGVLVSWNLPSDSQQASMDVCYKNMADVTSSALMFADKDLNVAYANPATLNMLREKEHQLRTQLPGFSVDKIVGSNIDSFHSNPRHQRSILADPSRFPLDSEVIVGGATFGLKVRHMVQAGETLGYVVEWTDLTDSVNSMKALEQLLEHATEGRLEHRVDVSALNGSFKVIGEQVNSLLEAVLYPISEVKRVVGALSSGNLNVDKITGLKGDFTALADMINGLVGTLNNTIKDIHRAGGLVGKSSKSLSEVNNTLNARTQSQAAALQQTAAAIEEITGTVQQNAGNATKANEVATQAREQAERGGEVVSEAVGAMDEISKSSRKISDIIGVIDEIAFQTNLLALNAAVEAARAGEQGRGFAVVASEVRNLAQRSAEAAKEIKTLIKDSVEKVEDGSRLVNKSGDTLKSIVDGVRSVDEIISQIATASEEQAVGILQINKAVTQMDETTQQNAVLVEDAKNSSLELGNLTRSLSELVNQFDFVGKNKSFDNEQASSVSNMTDEVSDYSGPPVQKEPESWAEF